MHRIKQIIEKHGEQEVLIQAIEECAELIQAACKLIRARRGTTPVSEGAARRMLIEELADVAVSSSAIMAGILGPEENGIVCRIEAEKAQRWEERLLDKEG